jgi:hypothetical protein
MASFLSDTLSNERLKLLVTAVASGAAVASLIFGYQALDRSERLYDLKHSIPSEADHEVHRVRETLTGPVPRLAASSLPNS